MSDDNSPSNAENQEDSEKTETNLSKPEETDPHLDEAMREKEQLDSASSPTVPPPAGHGWLEPAGHGWLEQFEAFGVEAFEEMRRVATQGLVEAESDFLIALAAKLLKLASEHDSYSRSKFDAYFDA